jgi:hypothetical protein
MAEHAHVTAWAGVKAGRERDALELWTDAITLYEKAKANGQIEDYETILFQPTGGAMPNGIITLWGTTAQVDAFARDPERMRLQARAMMLLDGLTETGGVRGGALLELMGLFDEVSGSLK